MNKKFRHILGTAGLITTIIFTGCGVASSSPAPAASEGKPAEITAETTADYKWEADLPALDGALCGAPLYIAYENGYFAEEGVKVTLISADSETRKVGLNNGSIPITNGDFQFFPSIESGVEVSVIDGLHNGCIKLVVKPDSPIQKAEDLKGLTIGVDEIGGTPYQVASVWLENAGISAAASAGEVTFVAFSDGSLELEALKNGDIDVAAMWDPLASVAEKAGSVRTILNITTDEPFAGKYCCFIYGSNKVLKEDPEEIYAMLRAIRKAQDFISKNPEEAVNIIIEGKYSQIEDKDLAIELISSYEYPSEETRKSNAQNTKENVLYFSKALNNIGYLKTPADEFIEKAYFDISDEDLSK